MIFYVVDCCDGGRVVDDGFVVLRTKQIGYDDGDVRHSLASIDIDPFRRCADHHPYDGYYRTSRHDAVDDLFGDLNVLF